MSKVKKCIYIIIGLISFALGIIGIIFPILPTTPFLLLASFCFARGSDRFDKWFRKTKVYKKYLEDFVKERAMTLKQKISLVLFADLMLAFPIYMTNNIYLRIFLIALIIFKIYYFTFRIRTKSEY